MLFFVRVFTGFSVATSVVALSQQSTKTAAAIIQADGINRIHDVLSADVLNNPDVANELQFYRVVTGSMSKHDSASVVVAGPPIDADSIGPGDAVAVRFNSRGGSVKAYGGVVVKLMARTVRVKFRGCAGFETFDVKTERVLTVAS